jgi:hypothetical protein
LRSQLEAVGLDTILQATESLEQSYISPPSYQFPTHDRSISDNTDFVFVIPVERESANALFLMVLIVELIQKLLLERSSHTKMETK